MVPRRAAHPTSGPTLDSSFLGQAWLGSLAYRVTALLTGLLIGVGLGILMADGRWWPIVAMPLLVVGLWRAIRSLVPPEDRAVVVAIVALSFALHVAAAVVLNTASVALGRGGFVPGDDAEYAFLSRTFVAYYQGQPDPASLPPWWGGAAYLFGTWTYIEIAIFFLTGPEVLVPILVNGAFAIVTSLLVYDMGRRLFDRRAALLAFVLTAFFPSLVLWSSLNLKDAVVLLVIALCLWALVRFQERPKWRKLAVAFAVLIPMESLRDYIFVGLVLLVPLSVAVTPRLTREERVRWGGAAAAVSFVFLTLFQTGVGLGPQLLETFESGRAAMAVGARTAYVEPPPVIVNEGDTFVIPTFAPVVETGLPAPPVAATVTPTPRIVRVAPNTRVVVVTDPPPPPGGGVSRSSTPIPTPAPTSTPSPTPTYAGAPTVAYVHPGDIVVVGSAETTPAPVEQRRTITTEQGTVQFRAQKLQREAALIGTAEHLPTGIAYALFAPFPWQIRRPLDLAPIPEMLVWYVALAAAVATAVRRREDLPDIFACGAFSLGLLVLFSLVEGNYGTLYRHRAMVLPWVILIASPTMVSATKVLPFARGRPTLASVRTPDAVT